MVVSSVHLCAFMNPLDDQFSLEPLIARNPTQQCKRKWDHTKCLARKQTWSPGTTHMYKKTTTFTTKLDLTLLIFFEHDTAHLYAFLSPSMFLTSCP